MNTEDAPQERDFTELFTCYHADVLAYCRRRLSAAGADDAVADTFMAAWRTFDRMHGDPRLWLLGIARGAVANNRRGRQRLASLQLRARTARISGISPDPGEHVGWEDTFYAAFGRLSESDQELLRLVSWEGLDAESIAGVLGCSAGNATVRLHRARRRLRRLLDADGSGGPGRVDTAAFERDRPSLPSHQLRPGRTTHEDELA
ncbi:MAG TPA: sigma-70 family RNA polymerase sigma factor [Acidimicrobiales bacterium]|jgi:RNA polymerase sigma-70 factor (ECF subfamily)|nr:sigma-70 family RNA polymerase sigma factor [Acidimicrobiales bacterium]